MTNIKVTLRVGNVNGAILYSDLAPGEHYIASKTIATNDVYFTFTADPGYYLPSEISRKALRDNGTIVSGSFIDIPAETTSWGDVMTALSARKEVELSGVAVEGDPVDPEDPIDPEDPVDPGDDPELVNVGLSIVKSDLPNDLLFFDLYINGALVPMVDYGGGYSEVDPVTVDYSNEFTIEFRCKPGSEYTFKDTIELRLYYDPIGGGSVFSDMLVIGDSAIAIVDLSNREYVPPGISIDVDVFSYQIMPQPTVTSFPFINIYDVELEQLELLNAYRFTELVYSADSIVEKDSDLSNYIVNLIKFPFSVAGGDPTNILIGDTLTTFTGSFIDNNLYEVDLGTIFVPMTIQGSVSFSNVTIECYVPYMKKFLLDPDEVLGKVLKFKMIVNLLTGLVTINVLNTFTNSIIHSDNVLVGESIPNAIGGGVDVTTDTILNTTTDRVYIEVKTLRPNNSTVTDQLLDVTGFIQVDNMLINSVATIEEQDEIRKLLRQGVFINE